MARHFVAASSQQLTNSSPPITAAPCTLACFYKPTQHVNRTWPLGVYNSGGGNFFAIATPSGNVQAYQFDFTTTGQDTTAGTVTDNVWNHVAAVFSSGTSQTAYLNGATSGPSTQAAVAPTGIDTTRIGQNVTEYLDGDVAEAAIWNVALTTTEIAILSAGASPLLVRPSALVAYWPLRSGYSPEIDLFGHRDLTLTNAPTVVAGPPIRLAVGLLRHRFAHPAANPTIAAIQTELNAANAAIGAATSLVATLTPSSTVDAINAQLAAATGFVSAASALVNVLGPSPTGPEIAAIQTQLTAALVAINNALALLNTLLGITGNQPVYLFEAFLNGAWADLTPDVINQSDISYGITGDGPMDSVASSGTCSFQLRNDAHAGKPLGYYSPNNANVRAGWGFGVPFRVRAFYNDFFYSRFYGKIASILPDAGTHRRRLVTVVAYDIMRSLAEADVQQVAIQVNKSESEVITNVLASLPSSEQPIMIDLDVGADTFTYALDNLGEGTKALSVLADVAHSSFYLIAQKGDGTLIGRSRLTRTTVTSSFAFTDSDMIDLEVPSDQSSVYNLIKLTSHPKSTDVSPTTVLYSMTGVVPAIPPNDTVTFWGTFNDSSNDQRLIGGIDVVTTLVAYPSSNYDYAGNVNIDGSGADVTSSLSVVATAFATTAKFDITNSSSVPVYLVIPSGTTPMLRIRGRGVYDRGPQQFQSFITQTYGTRVFSADLPYQGDPNVAQSACEYVLAAYNSLSSRASKLSFVAKSSPAKLFFALTVEPGDRITITESMTGLAGVDSIIQSVALSIIGNHTVCTLGLAPANAQKAWLWGVAGNSEWGQTTFYGF